MKRLFFALAIVTACSQVANATGPITSGGGSDYGLEFQASFEAGLRKLRDHSELSDVANLNFKILLPNLKIVVVEEILETNINGSVEESTAVNFPSNQLIKLNKDRWASIPNNVLKEGLAIHEMLSLIGKEGSGDYRYSSRYVAKYGVSPGELKQSFELKRKSRSYAQGKDKYTVVATERWVQNRVFDKIKIEYKILKNGKLLSSKDRLGGTMYSCELHGDPNESLPEDFVEVLSDGNSEFGFLIKGFGICGNTTSMLRHVIVPSSSGTYESKEVLTKTTPITRATSQGLEFWFIQQEWGKCGTAESFFVPAVFRIRPPSSGTAIKIMKLPKNVQFIPEFKNFEMKNFMSLFTAGLKTHDGQLMELASTYFSKLELNRYKECGLPTSKSQALELSESMKSLGESLDAFQ